MKKKSVAMAFAVGAIMTVSLMSSCKKPEGVGGDASIRGTVWVEDWDKNFLLKMYEYPGADEYVYIVYGDDISYGDRVKAGPDGSFEFKYLRTGHYKVYAYSDQKQTATTPSPIEAKIVEVDISGRKQTVDTDTIRIIR